MYRVAKHTLLGLAMVLALSSCASEPQQLQDTPTVEVLRLNITKVRNAIAETRATIAVSRGAPYLPEFYVRLAELLSEEARYHYQLAYEREQRSTKVLHVPQVRLLKEDAINTYEIVLSRFPDSPLVPRVLFNIGHEHRELGNFDEMRKVLNRLVDNYPDSPLRADALIVLGDYHFDRNELPDALRYYEEIAKGELTPVTGLGHYKLAWVWVNEGECKPALDNFEKAIERSNDWAERMRKLALQKIETPLLVQAEAGDEITTQQDIDVRRESLVDLAYCYSRLRKPQDSVKFLKKYAYNRETYVAALNKLANRYRTMDQFQGAVLITRELLSLGAANIDRLDDARTLYTSIKKLKDYRTIGVDAELIGDSLTNYYSRVNIKADERERLVKEFEVYLRDLATTSQERMIKKRRKSAGPEDVARAYKAYLDTIPVSDKRPDMLLNYADLLGSNGQELEAGVRSMEAADLLEDDGQRRDALYDAVVYFQASLAKESDRLRYERVAARSALRRAGATLLSYKLNEEKERRVKFAIAQAIYDEGLYVEAIDKLSAVAYEFPGTDEADAAVKLTLDSFNTLNDYDGLMYASRRFLSAGSPVSDKLKGEIKRIQGAAEQRKLDELALAAAGEDGADISPLIAFAEKNKGTDLGERALINAFVAARATGDTEKMYKLADSMAKTYPKSDQLPGIYTTLAQTAVARFDYDTAIRFMKRAADVNPSQRIRLLIAAGELNEQLGEPKKAEKLFDEALSDNNPQSQADALERLSSMIEKYDGVDSVKRKLNSYTDQGEPETNSRIGLAMIGAGNAEEGEMLLQSVLNNDSASGEALARAHFGMGELMLNVINQYPDPEDVDLIEEFIILIDVMQQSYLNAARQGSYTYAAASLSRLSSALISVSKKLSRMKMPDGLTGAQKQQVKAALDARVEGLEQSASEALTACGNQAWTAANFTPPVRDCLKGNALDGIEVKFDQVKSRSAKAPKGLDELRAELSKNPENVDKLRELAEKFLDAKDPHSARLVLARAIQVGGGALEQNLIGVASYEIGDVASAFDGFARAAEGGLEAGRTNMKTLLKKEGLSKQVSEVDKRFQKGRDGGRLIK